MIKNVLSDDNVRCFYCTHRVIDHSDFGCVSCKDQHCCKKTQKELFMELLSLYNNEIKQCRRDIKFNKQLNEVISNQMKKIKGE